MASEEATAYIEHQRELNRLRVARHRLRKRNGGKDVMPSLQSLVSTATKAVQAQVVDAAKPQLARMLKEEKGDVRRLIQHAVRKLDATEPWIMDSNGRCIERPSHASQDRARDYLTQMAERTGELPASSSGQQAPAVHIGSLNYQVIHTQDVVVETKRDSVARGESE